MKALKEEKKKGWKNESFKGKKEEKRKDERMTKWINEWLSFSSFHKWIIRWTINLRELTL